MGKIMIFVKNGFWMFIESLNPKYYGNKETSFADCLVKKILKEIHNGKITANQIVLIKPEDELEREAGSVSVTTISPDAKDLDEAEENYMLSNIPLSDVYEVAIDRALFEGYVIVCENFFASQIEEAEQTDEDIADVQPLWEEHNLEPDLVVYLDGEENNWFGYSRKFIHDQILALHDQDPDKYIILNTNSDPEELCDIVWELFETKSNNKHNN
jgi:hypothetical protein